MKIGVNGRFLNKTYTGVGQYTLYLFQALARQDPENKIVIFVNKPVFIDFPKNVELVVIKERPLILPGLKKTFWEQVQIPLALKKNKVDAAFFPYPSNPWRKMKIPAALTVHDVIPWTLEAYRKSFLTRLYQNRAKNAVKNAAKIFTVSHCSKDDIIKCCNISPDRIEVVYNGLSPVFSKSYGRPEPYLQKYGIDITQPYLLYIGGYDKRKNVATIIDTFYSDIATKFEVNLVLAGDKLHNNKLYSSFDLTKSKNLGNVEVQKGKVFRTGFIDEGDLPAIYQSSFAFLNLSEKEGFNLPLIEAAASKTPIITADTSVNREIIGEYAIFIPPKDNNKLAEVINKLIRDDSYYQKQKEKMKSYECPYSWEKAAKQILTSLSKLL
jgi:glycosyltransferase involved in cell wall biosynthesis